MNTGLLSITCLQDLSTLGRPIFSSLTLSSNALLTVSSPILNLSQTWNNILTTFTGIKLNITSTASAAASLLMDLQVGGTSQMTVSKVGDVVLIGGLNTGSGSGVSLFNGPNRVTLFVGGANPRLSNVSNGTVNWNNSITDANATADVTLTRDAAGVLATRVSTAAQALRVYNTFTSTTSLEYFAIDWQTTANVANLWTVKGSGGGTARNLVLGTDATVRLTIGATSGDITLSSSLIYGTSGKSFTITSGTDQRAGNVTLVGGTITVNNTTVTANTIVILTRKSSGGTIGTAITYTLSAGVSFTINSDNILDISTFSYLLFELV